MDWNQLSGPQKKLLRRTILSAYPTSQMLDIFLADNLDKGPLGNLVGPNGYEVQVAQFLPLVEAEGWTDRLVDALQADRPNNVLVRSLPDAIRAVGAEPPARLSSPAMQLEKIVQGGGFSDVRIWAESLALISEATCRIEFPPGQPQGTGFLVAPNFVLTNYHVVEKQLKGELDANQLVCRFGYARDASGLQEGTPVKLAPGVGWTMANAPYDKADTGGAGVADPSSLDYALLQLETTPDDTKPIPMKANAGMLAANLPVLIVQHPEGTPQALAIGKSLGANENGSRLRYDADTLGGSSGSGVFNQKLELTALHHAGDPRSVIRAAYNQGIPIGLIISSLSDKKVPKFWQ
jgi:V8-like Glu-specific endopeptidase